MYMYVDDSIYALLSMIFYNLHEQEKMHFLQLLKLKKKT